MTDPQAVSERSSRWIWFLVGRALSYAFFGGLATALVGGLVHGVVGAVTGWVLESSSGARFIRVDLSIPFLKFEGTQHYLLLAFGILGAMIGGVYAGGIGGFLLGALSFFCPPERRLLPRRRLVVPVAVGLGLGVVGLTTSFYLVVWVASRVNTQSLADQTGDFLHFLLYGLLAAMVAGAIAGAVWGWRKEGRHE